MIGLAAEEDWAAAAHLADQAYRQLLAAESARTGQSVDELDRESWAQVRACLNERHAEKGYAGGVTPGGAA